MHIKTGKKKEKNFFVNGKIIAKKKWTKEINEKGKKKEKGEKKKYQHNTNGKKKKKD